MPVPSSCSTPRRACSHLNVDVGELGCDFLAFSGHKAYGPTGIGVLYGRRELLDAMPPWQGGGDMILSVSFDKTQFNELPYKFEAGTPNIAGTIGLAPALDYLDQLGLDAIAAHEHDLVERATAGLEQIPGVRLIGTAENKASVVSFLLDAIHAHDVGTFLDQDGIAVRAGHHCAQPLLQRFGVPATVRASFGLYNTMQEVDRLVASVRRVAEYFA